MFIIDDIPKPVVLGKRGQLLNLQAQEILAQLFQLPPGQAQRVSPVNERIISSIRSWMAAHGPGYRMRSAGQSLVMWREEP